MMIYHVIVYIVSYIYLKRTKNDNSLELFDFIGFLDCQYIINAVSIEMYY